MSEDLMRDVKAINNSLDVLLPNGETYQKWFISFGTLLYLVRDFGKEYTTDIDVSVVDDYDPDRISYGLEQNGFVVQQKIIHSVTGEPLFIAYETSSGNHVDIFFWKKFNDYYWHTYDYNMERPDGIPRQYVFKGTPAHMFDGVPVKFKWFDLISDTKIPFKYGTLLDYWYPGWVTPDPDFGQSRGLIKKADNCQDLEGALCP